MKGVSNGTAVGYLMGSAADGKCAICIEEFGGKKVSKLACNHAYHSHCLKGWEQQQKKNRHIFTCPECRSIIKPESDSRQCSKCVLCCLITITVPVVGILIGAVLGYIGSMLYCAWMCYGLIRDKLSETS